MFLHVYREVKSMLAARVWGLAIETYALKYSTIFSGFLSFELPPNESGKIQ